MRTLTRQQQAIYDWLAEHSHTLPHPPTLDELCNALGLASRGSMHKHISALVDARLVEPLERGKGVRLATAALQAVDELPFLGRIAAGQPIQVFKQAESVAVPANFISGRNQYVLEVKGDSMIDEGILDGDHIIVESSETANNGEIVVALIDEEEATLKRYQARGKSIVLHPANSTMEPLKFAADRVRIQGRLVGLIRKYR